MSADLATRDIFVGRERERAEFHTLLREVSSGPRVLHLHGDGGTGKTRLLEWMIDESKRLDSALDETAAPSTDPRVSGTVDALRQRDLRRVRVTHELVDFYKTRLHTLLGLLQDIAQQLGLEHFPQFMEKRREFDTLVSKEADPSQRNEIIEQVRVAFFGDYARLTQDVVVILLFDTFEAAGWIGEDLLLDLLPGLTRHTLIVVVGRKQVSFPPEYTVTKHILQPLSPPDAIALFRQRGLSTEVVSDENIRTITDLVQGRPIYLALAVDWIANAEGAVADLVRPDPDEDLGRALVKRVMRLESPEDWAVLYLAKVWRAGDPGVLAHLLKMDLAKTKELTANLSRFSFIKYRPPDPDTGFPGSCLLHDEMRDLVSMHCWPEFDPTGGQQKSLLRSAIAYYETLLEDREGKDVAQGRRAARDLEIQNIQAEWLYYQLRLGLAQGVERMDPLFRDAAHRRELAFCQQLLDEVERREFWDRLPADVQAEQYFRKGLVMYRRERYDDAESWWSRVVTPHPANPKARATTLMLEVEMLGDRARIAEGLERAAQAEAAYEQLLKDRSDDAMLRKEVGELYNNWGRLLRIQGDLNRAKDLYESSLGIYKALPEDIVAKGRARTFNNLGYVYQEMGDLDKAKTFCGLALQMRKKMDIKYELGLSYNTMGMVLKEAGSVEGAADMFAKALSTFDEIQSEYGRGLALLNIGRVYRAVNDFQHALEALDSARGIFQRRDNREYLSETLNELGCAYRDRGAPGDDEAAEACFKESIELASTYGEDYLTVDNLVELAVLRERQGQWREALDSLSQAEPVIEKRGYGHLRSLSLWTRGNLLFAEGTDLEKAGDLDSARAKFSAAFDVYVDSAAECTHRMLKRGDRAGLQYQRVLDDIQQKMHSRPPQEIPQYANQLKARWQAKNLSEEYNDLINICDNSLSVVQYF